MFPDADEDPVMTISYVMDQQAYLIVNRAVVTRDIAEFKYSPEGKPEFGVNVIVFNEKDEKAMLIKFFEEIRCKRPDVYTTYNGDCFDWPYVENRARKYGLNLFDEIGVECQHGPANDATFRCRFAANMDCLKWVARDSYLPMGSRSLKAATREKLKYEPIEVDYEAMNSMAKNDPQKLAAYSVSDAVATYFLHKKYVNSFVFSLCSIIPMTADEIMKRGSGALCEALLMENANSRNIVFPNKKVHEDYEFYTLPNSTNRHLIKEQSYAGAVCGAFKSGVFRSDFEYKFEINSKKCQQLIDNLDRDLEFALRKNELERDAVSNYEEVRQQIANQLQALMDRDEREEKPLIYHLDVAAMYPNIIITNRIQPMAVVTQSVCQQCRFNTEASHCQRKMEWQWQGKHYTAGGHEFEQVTENSSLDRRFRSLSKDGQAHKIKTCMAKASKRTHGKECTDFHETREEIICQRENSFYVDTVRDFRDERYRFKKKLKDAKNQLEAAKGGADNCADTGAVAAAETDVLLYDSLQLAHKCILNSFYGYVARKGSRWYSVETAGIVTRVGADIINATKELIQGVGIPLELDTDGIWCMLPESFPDKFSFDVLGQPNCCKITYPCVMLNSFVASEFTNKQYHTFDEASKQYSISEQCSIMFEDDGPYRAMAIPSSLEEGKLLKKRYAVFNDDGSREELKGFEMKRRGELMVIKLFQEEIFASKTSPFTHGSTLDECYSAAASTAQYWLDQIDPDKVGSLYKVGSENESTLIELVSESKTMNKSIDDASRSVTRTCALRLRELLGEGAVKGASLNCRFVIARFPEHCKGFSKRAIPIEVFERLRPEQDARSRNNAKRLLLQWTGLRSIFKSQEHDLSIRNLLDWNYYRRRLGKAIHKIVIIPAIMQGCTNPLPELPYLPSWCTLKSTNDDSTKQTKEEFIQQFQTSPPEGQVKDIEDIIIDQTNRTYALDQRQQLGPEGRGVLEKRQEDRLQESQQRRPKRRKKIAITGTSN